MDEKLVQSQEKQTPLLEVKDLIVHYETSDGVVEAVNNISFEIMQGETFGLIGETGAGKTTTALSIMGLLPVPPSHIINGTVLLDGEDLYQKSDSEMQKIRGQRISMIFQDPMTALNPVLRVGDQLAECIAIHSERKDKSKSEQKAIDLLETVGIPAERFKDFPHQFSGGMKQRVVIAMALACRPDLIIADEPTTALDVTIQAQILTLMKNLRQQNNTAMLMITHDFGVVAEVCDRCGVMYAGELVEVGTLEDVFNKPLHPYTRALFDSLPSLDRNKSRLKPVKGMMADAMNLPTYCTFAERCELCTEKCFKRDPVLEEIEPGHFVKCFLYRGEEDE